MSEDVRLSQRQQVELGVMAVSSATQYHPKNQQLKSTIS